MTRRVRSAFSLLEVLVVVLILGILAAVVVPRFAGATDDARSSATEATVAGVRTALAAYRARAVMRGEAPFPSLEQLITPGVVMTDVAPSNPFTKVARVQAVSRAQGEARAVVNPGGAGWNYFVDNASDPPIVIFYANCEHPTTVPDGRGGVLTANQL